MKAKQLFFSLTLGLSTLMFTACPASDPEADLEPNGGEAGAGDKLVGGSVEDHKEYLESVALSFMELTPASDFEVYSNLANFCSEEFEDYDWDNVEDWADDAWNSLLVKRGSHDEKESYYYSEYIYHYINYDALVAASNFTGHFEGRNRSWTYSHANDLQFAFNDNKGQRCVALLTTSGATKEVHLGEIESWSDYYYYYSGGKGYTEETKNTYNTTIKVPENINVTLTQNGQTLVKVALHIDLSGLNGKEFTSASSLSLSMTTEFSNGYKIRLNQVKYSAGKSAEVSFTFANSKATLLTAHIGGDVQNLPNYKLSDIVADDFDDDDLENTAGNLTFARFDVIGKVQIEGAISDVRSFVDNIDEADSHSRSQSEMQKYLNKANRLMNAYLYYDNNGKRQAEVSLDAVPEESWYGQQYYEIQPMIGFSDGSRYSSFEAFFNDEDFAASVSAFKRLVNKYCDLFDEVDRVF